MFLFGYIIETLILYVWLKTIVKSELKNNNINESNIIRRTIKLIYDNRKIIMCNLFGWVQYNEEKKKNVENVKKYIINLFVPIVLCCPVYLLTPIFASCFLKKNILCIILYSVIITEIIIDGLKKYTQNF
ncbi:MAG: hypothetical protein IJA34_03055 [Lachnospiraceae bacterium]|nr:hypothetical protein [Lachnospiraceae bacterium]